MFQYVAAVYPGKDTARQGIVRLVRRELAVVWLTLLYGGLLAAQTNLAGRVVDETGAGVAGAGVEFRGASSSVSASTDSAGNFRVTLPAAGEYEIRAERQGFYVFHEAGRMLDADTEHITITLNHQREFSERVDVNASPPVVDPAQPADHREVDNTEMLNVPYPAPQDYRNALQLFDRVVQDNGGRYHLNGGDSNQVNYTLDGFNISNPVTGQLDARMNIDSVESIALEGSRFSAENGRGSAGTLELTSRMGDDHWRFSVTNFFPGVSTDGGFHINKWTPRVEVSGPIKKGRAWFHNGMDAFYNVDVVHGLPSGENRTHGLTVTDLSRLRIDLRRGNILTAGLLTDLGETSRLGLSFVNPAQTTTNERQALFVSSIRDQQYFRGGALVEFGFADTRGLTRDLPQGNQLYQLTPFGTAGNYYISTDQHFYRQQALGTLFLPVYRWHGTHLVKLGMDFERESFHEWTVFNPYEVLNADQTVTRYVTFVGAPFQEGKNFEGGQYVEDHWSPREDLTIEAGARAEWNEIVRELETAPRLAASWAPPALGGTKLSAGWGLYYDPIYLGLVTTPPGQASLATFYASDGSVAGPVETQFSVNRNALKTPYFRVASMAAERMLSANFTGRIEFMNRTGDHGFSFVPAAAAANDLFLNGATFYLGNSRQDSYRAVTLSVKHSFSGKFEWSAGYTRSSARSNEAVTYSLANPIFAPQMPGPLAWDAPNRIHAWGWAPVPRRRLPRRLQVLIGDTTAALLAEYRTGLPFSAVTQQGFVDGPVNSLRLPGYVNVNLHFERKFHAMHYLWAWRFGMDNLTNHLNPNAVNNVIGTPEFLSYGRGQARAFAVRLRLLGRK
ncbi:MAG: carboxypeptidase regulatory-like domain-containing protein [Bryobacteraceae bacterium]